jgi:hypothetical protein
MSARVEREVELGSENNSCRKEHAMKRREFLTSSATLVGAAAFGGLAIGPSRAADQPVKGGTLI